MPENTAHPFGMARGRGDAAGRAREELLNSRESAACGGGARLDGLIGAGELIPGKSLDIRTQHKVRFLLPDRAVIFLNGADRAAEDLKNVCGIAGTPIVKAYRDADNTACAQMAGFLGGDWGNQAAIRKPARAKLHRFEKAGECTAGPDRIGEGSVAENHGLAAAEVGGDGGEGDEQLLKGVPLDESSNEVAEALVAGEAETREAPTGKIAKAHVAAGRDEPGERCAARIGRAQDAADAGAHNPGDGDVVLFENLEHAQMGESAGKAAAQRQRDAVL